MLGKHVRLWLEWRIAGTSASDNMTELVRLWKKRRVKIPGAKHFRHVRPADEPEELSESEDEISAEERQALEAVNGK